MANATNARSKLSSEQKAARNQPLNNNKLITQEKLSPNPAGT